MGEAPERLLPIVASEAASGAPFSDCNCGCVFVVAVIRRQLAIIFDNRFLLSVTHSGIKYSF